MYRIQIVGKKGRHVTVLLTKKQKKQLDTLNRIRTQAGVDEVMCLHHLGTLFHQNKAHMFYENMPKCVERANQISLLQLCCANMYSYTVLQILSLKINEMDALANFLGHNIRVHREYYRLPDSTLSGCKNQQNSPWPGKGNDIDNERAFTR